MLFEQTRSNYWLSNFFQISIQIYDPNLRRIPYQSLYQSCLLSNLSFEELISFFFTVGSRVHRNKTATRSSLRRENAALRLFCQRC